MIQSNTLFFTKLLFSNQNFRCTVQENEKKKSNNDYLCKFKIIT